MRTRIFLIISLFCLLLAIAGCGGGGGDSSTGPSGQRKAVSSAGLPVAAGAVQLTLNFPVGITVATDTNGKPTADVVQLVGGPTTIVNQVVYIPATTAAKGQLKLYIVSDAVSGFAIGEYISIQMVITPDTSIVVPVKADFSITDVSIFNLDGVEVKVPDPDFTFETI